MAIRNGAERRLEVGEWLNAVDFAGLDQRCDAAPSDAAFVVTDEERILPIEGDRPD